MSINKTAQNNSNAHITFIGGGNMGRALISGLLANGFEPNQISVVEANAVTALKLYEDYGVQGIGALEQIAFDFSKNNVVVMAIKPQDFNVVAKGLAAKLKHASAPGPLILSIAAGIRLKDMSRWLDHTRCVRAMPNTPALIGKGITGLFADAAVDQADRALAETICNAVGQAVWVSEEKLMDAVRIGTIPISPRYFQFPSNIHNKLKSISPRMILIILSIFPTFFIACNLLF